MMPTLSRIGVAAAWLTLAASARAEAPGVAKPEDTLNTIVELNKKALLAYDALEMETASALLHQALTLCKSHGLDDHPTAARTHLHLGVVYISGLKFPELGEAEFRQALAIDPKIQVPKSLINPEVQAAFEEALWWETAPKDLSKRLPFPTGKEPPGPSEPESAPGVRHIKHPLVTQATRGQAIEIKAQVPPGMGAAKVMLAYMAQDASEFLAREMTPIENVPGWFRELIPVEATRGTWVAYYIEAQDSDDAPLASNGNADAPHEITLVPEGGSPTQPTSKAGEPARPRAKAGSGHGLWAVLALGSGGGYHRGAPEMNPRDARSRPIEVAGLGAAQLLHLAPEIGYFHRSYLILSAQGRFQYVTGTQDIRIGKRTYQPAAMAFAGLVKVTWLFTRSGNRLQPFVNAQAGGGQIRHTITTPESANLTGCGEGPTCRDTVLGGPGLVGAGAGFTYRVGEGLGLYAACNLLAGFPDFMINGDLNLGVVIIR
jgi:hypothetical protein